jgi:GTP-binding protein
MTIHDVQFVTGAVRWDGLPADGLPEVAFVGRSNVGKSSLLNMLVGRAALARTSGTPGKTQQFNYYLVNRRFYLVDLPGFGYAKVARTERERWGRLIERYLTARPSLRAVFHLIDGRHAPTALDEALMGLMRGSPAPYVIVLTKTDKLSGNERTRSKALVEERLRAAALEVPLVLTSAKTKRGRDELLAWIDHLVPAGAPDA